MMSPLDGGISGNIVRACVVQLGGGRGMLSVSPGIRSAAHSGLWSRLVGMKHGHLHYGGIVRLTMSPG